LIWGGGDGSGETGDGSGDGGDETEDETRGETGIRGGVRSSRSGDGVANGEGEGDAVLLDVARERTGVLISEPDEVAVTSWAGAAVADGAEVRAFTTSLSRLARLRRTYGGGGRSRVSTTWILVDAGTDAGTGAGSGGKGSDVGGGGDETGGETWDGGGEGSGVGDGVETGDGGVGDGTQRLVAVARLLVSGCGSVAWMSFVLVEGIAGRTLAEGDGAMLQLLLPSLLSITLVSLMLPSMLLTPLL
jgi:hypothetical protein